MTTRSWHRANAADEKAFGAGSSHDLGDGLARDGQVGDDDVGVDLVGFDRAGRSVGEVLRDQARVGVVLGEAVDVVSSA